MRVVYLSYDGALDPLGASQVVPYLLGLSRHGLQITLISFEKAGFEATSLLAEVAEGVTYMNGERVKPSLSTAEKQTAA